MLDSILRMPKVITALGKSRSSAHEDVKKGLLTEPVRIGLRAVGWPESEVSAINAARIAGKSDGEIRELVRKLHAARKSLT
jgi:prophage regulatory protein